MRKTSGTLLGSLALVGTLLAAAAVVAPARAADPVPEPPAPTVSQVRVFGTSVKGRALRAYRVGDPAATRKVVLLSTMHGDEAGKARILLDLMRGPSISGADIWIIPYLNRDGFARGTRKNARGVDLNRNFPTDWKRQTGKYYSGRAAASEPETRALMRFLNAVDPDFVVSLHQPLYGVDTSYGKARPLALRLAQGLRLPRKVFNCTSGCHGTMTQWFNRHHAGAALTVEYGARVTTYQSQVTGPTGLLGAVFSSR
ncbi:MAG: DUF2817 domain-containing protein [Propionibacteriales bacterium]|nr:DUF2817 domain-containing protein [Propionibacteriales bacterium]